MKKLEELGISPAPWVTALNAEGEYAVDVVSPDYTDVANCVNASDARLIAAAPKLYDAGWKTEAVLEKLFTLDEFAALLKSGAANASIACRDELRAALAEAAGESEVRHDA